MIDQGIRAVDSIDRIFDYGFTQGGPVLRDKLWFFTSWRLWGVWNPVTDIFLDDGTQFRDEDQIWSPVVRFTYQATQRNKITMHVDRQAKSRGPKLTANYPLVLNSAGSDPETARTWQDPGLPYGIAQAKWTSTISSRVLAEAGYSMSRTYVRYRAPFGVNQPRESDLWYERVRKQDLDTGQLWGASYDGLLQPIRHLVHGSVSYVTGSHNFKGGFQNSWGRDTRYQDINGDIDRVRYRSGVPDVVRVRNVPLVTDPRLKYDLGLYAQDAWTLDRLTVNAGIRFELLNSYVNTQSAPAGRFVGVRSFPRTDNVPDWSDVTPRLGLSYDLLGDAKTALKFSIGKYMTPHTTSFAIRFNPMAATNADVPWDDRDLGGLDLATNGDDIPQDNELDLAGRLPENFGERALDRFDPDIEREYNVETAIGIQHELVQNVSVNVGWYRRAFHNFYTDDNLLRDFNHYRPIDIVSPHNGEVITAWDLKDSASLRDVDVLVTNATEGRAQVYNGFELSLNARLPGGGTFIGSTTTQRIVTEHCDDLDDPNNLRFCDRGNLPSDYNRLPWRSDLKLAGSYPLPYDIQVSANFTSMPGRNKGDLVRIDEILPINWNISRGTRYTAAGCAGRPCTAGELVIPDMQLGSLVVPLVPAGTERFLPRQSMLNFGIRKIFQTRDVSYEASFELFNALNANTVIAERSANFGTAAYAPALTNPARADATAVRDDQVVTWGGVRCEVARSWGTGGRDARQFPVRPAGVRAGADTASVERTHDMKQLKAAVLALVLIPATLGVFPAAQGQEQQVDLEQLLTDFSRQISDPGMSVSIMVVHLNDVTTDALFTPPVKYSLRAQARQRTLFYVRGTANRNHWVDMEFASWQGTRNFRVQTTNISNFEPDTRLSGGEKL